MNYSHQFPTLTHELNTDSDLDLQLLNSSLYRLKVEVD